MGTEKEPEAQIPGRRKFLRAAGMTTAALAAARSSFAGSMMGALHPGNSAIKVETQASPQKLRGLMVDAARLPETMAYYRRVIEFCSEWEMNTLQFRLADDQGSAMRFTSVPDLVTHSHAFTSDELRSLVAYGTSHGVDLIPEMESFGHTGFITRSPNYAHLSDSDPVHGDAEFTGIIPVHPETLPIFEKLYREVVAVFPSVYLHGGCDEVNWGGSALSREALKTKGRPQVWSDYLNALNRIATGLGKQFIVWGDFVLHKEPQILDQLDKKIVIMDWDYANPSASGFSSALEKVSARGTGAIGAPALACYRWGPRPGAEQLRNIDACADAYFSSDDAHALGVILTNWAPSRYVQDSIWDGFAYAAVAFRHGTTAARTTGFRRFVERHYRAPWNETWEETFELIYSEAPYREKLDPPPSMGSLLPIPWATDEQLKSLLKVASPRENPFTRIRSLLVDLEPLVTKNLSDFRAFSLSIRYLEALFLREDVVFSLARSSPSPEAAELLIRNIAARDQELLEALNADWDRGRFPDAPEKRDAIFLLEPSDELLRQWNLATAYSTALAQHPERFRQLLS